VVYRAAFDHMHELLAFLTENCCEGEACMPATASATASTTSSACGC
jgi:ArsR family transcriptional regulator